MLENKIQEENLVRISVRLVGISPILMNALEPDFFLHQGYYEEQRRRNELQKLSDKERAERKILRNEQGLIGIPAAYFFSCIREAGRHVIHNDRKYISTKSSTHLSEFLSIEGDFFPFEEQEASWRVRKNTCPLGCAENAVIIVRPCFDHWSFRVPIQINEDRIESKKVRNLFEIAGKIIGLGDFRPARHGIYGRFTVGEWIES